MSSKLDEDSKRFSEWWILHDNLVRFQRILRDTKRVVGKGRITVYGVGSPRNCAVVTSFTFKGGYIQKVIRVDIRDGSCETWLEKFDKVNWTAQNF